MMSNRDPIDLRGLTALVTVADVGSFRAAAQTLGYTQSAISHQVSAIERRLGIQVFDRPGGRGQITLTPLGERAYQHAHRVLASTQALDADLAAALAGERGTLRIGVSQSTCYVLAEPLAQLRRQSPGIDVSLINTITAEGLVQQLADGRVDVGLYVNVESDERVVTLPLFEDSWMIVAHRDDPIAASASVALDVLDGADMIAWHLRWRAQANLERLWRQRRIRPRIVYRTGDALMIQRLVAAGLGCACLGGLSAQGSVDPRLRRISVRDELPARTLAVCHARQRELTPAAVALVDLIRRQSPPAYLATSEPAKRAPSPMSA